MDEFVYADDSESTFEDLLIWWGTRHKFEHSDDCKYGDNNNVLDCCRGKNSVPIPMQGIEGCSLARWPENIALNFIDEDRSRTLIEVGDKIVYHRDSNRMELVKNDDRE